MSEKKYKNFAIDFRKEMVYATRKYIYGLFLKLCATFCFRYQHFLIRESKSLPESSNISWNSPVKKKQTYKKPWKLGPLETVIPLPTYLCSGAHFARYSLVFSVLLQGDACFLLGCALPPLLSLFFPSKIEPFGTSPCFLGTESDLP